MFKWRRVWLLAIIGCLGQIQLLGQIDPVERQLLQVGYNGALQGHSPLSAYAFYYYNKPQFLETNLTLRLVVAPTWLDSELGISHILGDTTDLGIGVAGGGFGDSYEEVHQGKFEPKQSFTGHGGELNVSLYHLFNPGARIPLNGVLRGIGHYTVYERNSDTAKDFDLPEDRGTFSVRTGLRWGGREPTLFPSLAMELSIWYQGEFRSEHDIYGFPTNGLSGDRRVETHTHLFWAEALLAYTMEKSKHSFYLSMTAGTSMDADRFSAYRLGALLPLVAEFPLSLPGYYYQEISARSFLLFGGNYIIPLDKKQRWNINATAATALVDYLPGLEQPGDWHSGVGAGLLYKSDNFKLMIGYAYGIDAIRTGGPGAHSIGLLMQVNMSNARATLLSPDQPSFWRGMQRVLGVFGS
jgi:hypothetical protein